MRVGLPSRGSGDRSAVGWGSLAVAGLALGVIALGSARTAPLEGAPGVRLALRIPDWLLTTVVGLVVLAGLLLLLVIFQGRRRRRKKGEEEFPLASEPPKVSPWAMALVLAVALLPLALLVYTLRTGWAPGLEWGGLGARRPPAGLSGGAPEPAAPPGPVSPERPVVGAPVFGRILGLLLLLAGVGSLGVMLWLWLGDRLAWLWGRPAAGPPAGPLLDAVEESLEDLQREADARRAVILCYRRFERWAGDSGVPRSAWETPLEFLRRVLGRLPIPPDATASLTRLFVLSRFSHHALGPAERDAALRALTAIRTALEASKPHAPAA